MPFDRAEILVDYLETISSMQPTILLEFDSGWYMKPKPRDRRAYFSAYDKTPERRAADAARKRAAYNRKKEERRNGTRDSL